MPREREATWEVWRQDDNGNAFLILVVASEEEARRFAEVLERRGHKQLYWVVPTETSSSTRPSTPPSAPPPSSS